MSLTTEQARFVADTRRQIVENMQANREPDFGISKETLKQALDIVRQSRSIGAASSSKASKKSSEPVVPIDLDALMGKKK